jgi:hypothetical protein
MEILSNLIDPEQLLNEHTPSNPGLYQSNPGPDGILKLLVDELARQPGQVF